MCAAGCKVSLSIHFPANEFLHRSVHVALLCRGNPPICMTCRLMHPGFRAGITQRDYTTRYEFLVAQQEAIQLKITEFFADHVQHNFPNEHCMSYVLYIPRTTLSELFSGCRIFSTSSIIQRTYFGASVVHSSSLRYTLVRSVELVYFTSSPV